MNPGRSQYLKPGCTREKGCALSPLGHGPVTAQVPHPAEGTLLSSPIIAGPAHSPWVQTQTGKELREVEGQRQQVIQTSQAQAHTAKLETSSHREGPLGGG